MLACITVAALVCAICAALGFGSLFSPTSAGQSIALLIMALSALVLLGAFDAYEGSADPPEEN